MINQPLSLLRSEVIDQGLCTRCGSCVGVCPGQALAIEDELGECLPVQVSDCIECKGECYLGCSGKYVDFPALNEELFGQKPEHMLLGNFQELWIANATDAELRRNAASGGAISALLEHLFQTKRIAGAYVLGMDPEKPYAAKPFLARSVEELAQAAQSKYVVTPHNVGLAEIEAEGPDLAYVGVPCQVHSIRKLQRLGVPQALRFRYVLGIYCGNILHFSSTQAFLAKHGVDDLEEITSLQFRAGEWPGNMEIRLKSGRVISMPKFHANYLIPFHIMKRCLLCADLSNEFADVSGGDAWAPQYEERGKGFSMLVVRSAQGKELVDELVGQGKLEVSSVTYEECVSMHSHGLDLKKRGALLRIKCRGLLGGEKPLYGFNLAPGVPFSRWLMEIFMGIIFRVCWTAPARWCIQRIPNKVIAKIFQTARTQWKSVTRSTKKTGLSSIEFVVDNPGGVAASDWQCCECVDGAGTGCSNNQKTRAENA